MIKLYNISVHNTNTPLTLNNIINNNYYVSRTYILNLIDIVMIRYNNFYKHYMSHLNNYNNNIFISSIYDNIYANLQNIQNNLNRYPQIESINIKGRFNTYIFN